tara:strand:+ start:7063 stop:8355 length:1293 start_codon:yes stop_codon:yes gene_type:complete
MFTINNIIFNTSAMTSALTVRQFTVVGDPGAQFTMTATNEDSHFYNFSEEVDKNGDLKVALAFTATPDRLDVKTLDESGSYTGSIQFPAITDDDHYYITLYAVNDTVLNANLSTNKVYILPKIYKYKDTTVTFSLSSAASSGSYNTLPSNVTVTGISSSIDSGIVTPVTASINWPVSLSTSQFIIAKQLSDSDFEFTTTTTTTSASDATGETHYIEVADISKLSSRMDVSGTGIASNSIVRQVIPGYKDYNKSSDLEDVYTIPKIKSTNAEGVEIISDSPGGTIIISNSSTWNSGVTLTFTGSNENLETFNNTVLEFSNLTLTLDPVVTTTDDTVSNSTTIPLTSTDGIKAADTVLMTGIGVTDSSPHVDAVSAGVNITASSAQTLENGQTVTFTGSSRNATITADIKVLQYGIDDVTITLALDNILTVG